MSGPTTLDFTLPPRSDAFGYTCELEEAAFEQADTVVPLTGDDEVTTIDLPFPFRFYGETYTRTHLCTNGFVEFVGPATTNCSASNAAIPTTGRPNGAVYGYWDDLQVDAQASIRADVRGSAPNRRYVIEFRNVHFFNDSSRRIDFNIVLHENGEILTQYQQHRRRRPRAGQLGHAGDRERHGDGCIALLLQRALARGRARGDLDPVHAPAGVRTGNRTERRRGRAGREARREAERYKGQVLRRHFDVLLHRRLACAPSPGRSAPDREAGVALGRVPAHLHDDVRPDRRAWPRACAGPPA